MSRDINDLLSKAQSSYSSLASSYVANEDDKKNLKEFCKLHLEVKDLKGGVTQNTKQLLSQSKSVKNIIKLEMEKNNYEVLKLNQEEPKYVRLSKVTRSIPITFEVLREVFQNFSEDMMEEEENEDDEKGIPFVKSIINNLKLKSKSLSSQVRLTSSLPRGFDISNIVEAPEEIKQISRDLNSKTEEVKNIRAQTRNTLKEKSVELDKVKKDVDEYLNKANVTNQQINYNELPFTLTKRVTSSKPKLSVANIENFLTESCIEIETSLKKRPKNMNSYFVKNKLHILEKLEEKLLSLPQEQKSNIFLRKLNDLQQNMQQDIIDSNESDEEMEEMDEIEN